MALISGAHVMIFTRDEDADRAFLRDVLEIPCIDGGGGWLIYKLPPAEMGVHGGEQNDVHHLYLMCDDARGQGRRVRRTVHCELGPRDLGSTARRRQDRPLRAAPRATVTARFSGSAATPRNEAGGRLRRWRAAAH